MTSPPITWLLLSATVPEAHTSPSALHVLLSVMLPFAATMSPSIVTELLHWMLPSRTMTLAELPLSCTSSRLLLSPGLP